MRRIIRLSTVFLTLALAAQPALAAAPTRDPSPLPPGTILDLEGVCAFPVQVGIFANKEYTLTFPPDADGTIRQLVNGRLVARFTNLDTDASVTRNISGPGDTMFYPDGTNTLTAQGVWAIFFEGARGAGRPRALFINSGPIVRRPEADLFTQEVLKQVGPQEDLCAVLD